MGKTRSSISLQSVCAKHVSEHKNSLAICLKPFQETAYVRDFIFSKHILKLKSLWQIKSQMNPELYEESVC